MFSNCSLGLKCQYARTWGKELQQTCPYILSVVKSAEVDQFRHFIVHGTEMDGIPSEKVAIYTILFVTYQNYERRVEEGAHKDYNVSVFRVVLGMLWSLVCLAGISPIT